MSYIIKARYYADNDQLGESYIITSNNGDIDANLEVGRKVDISYIKNSCRDVGCKHNKDGICKFKGDCDSRV